HHTAPITPPDRARTVSVSTAPLRCVVPTASRPSPHDHPDASTDLPSRNSTQIGRLERTSTRTGNSAPAVTIGGSATAPTDTLRSTRYPAASAPANHKTAAASTITTGVAPVSLAIASPPVHARTRPSTPGARPAGRIVK